MSSGIFPNTPEYNSSLDAFTQPWIRFFIQYGPTDDLRKIKCPVFALNGEKDIQVPPTENLNNIRTNLEKGGNENFKIKKYPNLNHLFQTCETGAINEYRKIEETISPKVLKEITGWILDTTK